MSWDCNLHCLAVLTGRVPTCTSTLLRFPAPGCSSRYPKEGFCPFPILPLPLGMPPLPSPLFGAAWLCRGPWLRSQQGERRDLVAAPRSAPRGRSGSGEAPSRARRGRFPDALSGAEFLGHLGALWGKAVPARAGAGAGALPSLWGRAGRGAVSEEPPGGPAGGFVSDKGGVQGKDGGGSWGIRAIPVPPGITTASLHSRAVPAPVSGPFHFWGPPGPLLTGI